MARIENWQLPESARAVVRRLERAQPGTRIIAVPRADMRIRDRDGRWHLLWSDQGVGRHTCLAPDHELVRDHPEHFEFIPVRDQYPYPG